ncbi:hypothetical protein FVQ89_07670 [Homoserinibacter sp. GY 40078]|nr:hypothetical protein FVQ89_07670 [Homoserinibacter sp. GY 40078]
MRPRTRPTSTTARRVAPRCVPRPRSPRPRRSRRLPRRPLPTCRRHPPRTRRPPRRSPVRLSSTL